MKLAHLPSPVETLALAEAVDRCVREVRIEDLARSPRGTVRVVSRKALLGGMLDVVDLFVRRRLDSYASQLAAREEEALEDGRMRVLTSVADLLDLVETLAETLNPTTSKALRRRVERIFTTYGFARTDTVGAPFDPRFHEAIDAEEADGREPGSILREASAGFRRGDYVLRLARVVVVAGTRNQEEKAS